MEKGPGVAPFIFYLIWHLKFYLKPGLKNFIPAIAWFITTAVLLTLPASQFPQDALIEIPQQDKIIHIVLFSLLVYLFCLPFKTSSFSFFEKKSWFIRIAFYGLAYGIAIEFIQKYFVPNRSYDGWDILADAIGCLLGYLCSVKYLLPKAGIKNKPR
jgi:hypothetical protein